MSALGRAGYKQTEVGVIPEDWAVLTVSTLTTEFRGGAPLKPTDFTDRGVKVLPKGGVGRTGILRIAEKDIQYCRPEYADAHPRNQVNKAYTIVVLRDLVPSGPSIGLMVEIDTEESFVLAQGVYGFKVNKERADARYLIQLSNTSWYRNIANSIMVGSTQVHITNTAYKNVALPVPPLSEQRAIATALSDVDALLAKLDALVAKKRDLKVATMQQLLTGQNRLPGFSGEWEVKRLGDVAEVDPENLGSGTAQEYGFKYISLEDVDVGSLRGFSEQVFATAPSRARRRLRVGDVLISTVRPNLMSHLWFKEVGTDWICSTGFAVVRCHKETAHPGFIFAHLFGRSIARQIETLVTGSNYPAINSRDVRAFEIAMPSYSEQTAIATVLSDMDAELTTLEARRDKTRALKQGMMQELLIGRIRLV